MKKITGTLTALVTPFQETGEIDVQALKDLVSWQIESGINGLVPCGSTGEAATMSFADYKLVVSTVIAETAGRVPVIAGATSNDTEKAIEFSKIAKEAGADMLLHATPFYNKPTLNGLVAHYKAIANKVNLPILIYNVPGRTALNVTAPMLFDIIKKVPEVVGVKEAAGDIKQVMSIIKGVPSDFSTLAGDDFITFPLMALGGQGIISVVSNEIPAEMTQLSQSALAGDWEKARKLHFGWLDLMNVNFIESNPQPVKAALYMMGKIKEVFRLPLVKMDESNKLILKKILQEHKLI